LFHDKQNQLTLPTNNKNTKLKAKSPVGVFVSQGAAHPKSSQRYRKKQAPKI